MRLPSAATIVRCSGGLERRTEPSPPAVRRRPRPSGWRRPPASRTARCPSRRQHRRRHDQQTAQHPGEVAQAGQRRDGVRRSGHGSAEHQQPGAGDDCPPSRRPRPGSVASVAGSGRGRCDPAAGPARPRPGAGRTSARPTSRPTGRCGRVGRPARPRHPRPPAPGSPAASRRSSPGRAVLPSRVASQPSLTFSATRSTASSPGPISTESVGRVPTAHLQRPGRHRVALGRGGRPAPTKAHRLELDGRRRPRSGGSPRPARPGRRRPTTRAVARGVRRRGVPSTSVAWATPSTRTCGPEPAQGPGAAGPVRAAGQPLQAADLHLADAQGLPGCAGTLRTLEGDGQPAVRHERLQLLREVQVDQPLLISRADRRARRRDHVTRGPGDRQRADLAPAGPGELERGLLGVAGGEPRASRDCRRRRTPPTRPGPGRARSRRPRWPCRRPARAGRRCRRPAPRPQCR